MYILYPHQALVSLACKHEVMQTQEGLRKMRITPEVKSRKGMKQIGERGMNLSRS